MCSSVFYCFELRVGTVFRGKKKKEKSKYIIVITEDKFLEAVPWCSKCYVNLE